MARTVRAGTRFADVEVASRAEWRSWLLSHHTQSEPVWLVTWRKHVGDRHLPYGEAVEEALCFGWIDSLPRKLDEDRTKLLMSPRSKRSGWSAANRERVDRLTAAGLMMPAGLAAVADAKASGAWDRLVAIEDEGIAPDLAAALDAVPPARTHFEAFPPSTRRGILEWIATAKTPATRLKRIEETARLAADNIRANPYRQPKR